MNHINTIEIKNFKSIRHQKIEGCKRVNVFIGYPNVGKSNILEALTLFEIGILGDVDFRNLLRFENYSNLFYNNNISESILVNLNDSEKVELSVRNKELFVKSQSNKMFFEMEIPLSQFDINSWAHVINASEEYDSLERLEIKKYIFNNNKSDGKNQVGFSRELTSPYGENLVDVISSNSDLKREVINILKDYNLKYATDENNRIRVVKEYKEQEVKIFPYVQIAETIQRLIFHKAAIYTNKNSILLFEEPEAHMFPPYISKLTGDIMYDENKNQFFIATHSPYVLNDFISDLSIEELALFIVTYDKINGETIIQKMSDSEVNEAYQFGYDFFMNINQFIQKQEHE
jgi:AAA15 family ATPase/GTPase